MSEIIENPRFDLDGDRRSYVTSIDAYGEKIVTGVLPGHVVGYSPSCPTLVTDPDRRNAAEIRAKQSIVNKSTLAK